MDDFGGVIIVRQEFNETSNRGRRVGLLRHLGSRPQSMMDKETAENVGSFWTSSHRLLWKVLRISNLEGKLWLAAAM